MLYKQRTGWSMVITKHHEATLIRKASLNRVKDNNLDIDNEKTSPNTFTHTQIITSQGYQRINNLFLDRACFSPATIRFHSMFKRTWLIICSTW